MNCPVCQGRDVGQIANGQFYCWNCFVVYQKSKEKLEVFEVDDEGSLVALEKDEYDDEF
ncbi:hypothetical protein PRVXH_001911 [Proteinivorax hydrogeniformans]|uniref:Uncharacterized protein n=1 Tax=Proteinivorax hydrogeniformans TaxID=1826727 RepID=A0AAU8HQZ5_9FIRM